MQIDTSELAALIRKITRRPAKRALLVGDPIQIPNDQPTTIAAGTYVIVRCRDAGVHAGELVSYTETGCVYVKNSRRIWRFFGAQTLSEIAVYGCTGSTAKDSKIAPKIADTIALIGACELLPCLTAGRSFLESAPEWKC